MARAKRTLTKVVHNMIDMDSEEARAAVADLMPLSTEAFYHHYGQANTFGEEPLDANRDEHREGLARLITFFKAAYLRAPQDAKGRLPVIDTYLHWQSRALLATGGGFDEIFDKLDHTLRFVPDDLWPEVLALARSLDEPPAKTS